MELERGVESEGVVGEVLHDVWVGWVRLPRELL